MEIKGVIWEDFNNYRLPSLFIGTSSCPHNCEGCQNEALKLVKGVKVTNAFLIDAYVNNPITKAIVLGGLDPLMTFEDTYSFVKDVRKRGINDTIIIYTGFKEEVVDHWVEKLVALGGHLVVKYGKYIKGHEPHMDSVLGVRLASDNQYAKEYNNGKN